MTPFIVLVQILAAILLGVALGFRNSNVGLCDLKRRIKELGEKSTQVLIFLSFAIAAVVFLAYGSGSQTSPPVAQRILQNDVLRWWVSAIFPVIIGVLPIKEFRWDNHCWYRIVRWSKFGLLWVAILDITIGALKFFLAI